MTCTTTAIDTMNSLLRGELSATETYQQALAKLDNGPGSAELQRIHVEHRTAANEFRQHVHQLGGKPDQGSGAWGTFAKAVEGAATMLGNKAALKALKEGEEHGIASYEEAANNPDLPQACRDGLRQLASRTREHVATLDRLMGA
jgi:uncharacterized protein (TIGR02284 family)